MFESVPIDRVAAYVLPQSDITTDSNKWILFEIVSYEALSLNMYLRLASNSSSVPQVLEIRVLNHARLQFLKISTAGENYPTGMTKDLSLSTFSTCNNPQATCTTQDLLCHGHSMIYSWSLGKKLKVSSTLPRSPGFTAIFPPMVKPPVLLYASVRNPN